MSSGKNSHISNGWKAFSYFCCSAWNDTYLIDISKAKIAGDLHTQRSQFVPVTQIYKSIDNLMSQRKLYSAFEYPMAPDMKSNTHIYSNYDIAKNKLIKTAAATKGNLASLDASGITMKSGVLSDLEKLDNSLNSIGQGVKSKPKMYDSLMIEALKNSKEYSVAVTPTRWGYFGQKQGNLVANTKPQRVMYVVSAELLEPGKEPLQMRIVKSSYELETSDSILIQPDIDMDAGDDTTALKSMEFGDVTASYSYNWDVKGFNNDGINPKPLSQSGGNGSKYLVISSIPSETNADNREYVNHINDEFYGISIKDVNSKALNFGYVSYQSLGDKSGLNDDLESGANSGYTFPRSNLSAYQNPSVWDDNWFKNWVAAYGDLANAMQGKSARGSENFISAFLGLTGGLNDTEKRTVGFSRLVNQSAIINTNHLKKLLYVKTNNNISVDASLSGLSNLP